MSDSMSAFGRRADLPILSAHNLAHGPIVLLQNRHAHRSLKIWTFSFFLSPAALALVSNDRCTALTSKNGSARSASLCRMSWTTSRVRPGIP